MIDGVRVLFVDDVHDEIEMYAFALERKGARVATAMAADEALELADHETFDVIVSDLSLPGMSGLELMRVLRARGLATPAIALTGWSGEHGRAEALAAGFQMHCAKPCPPAELVDSITRLLSLGAEGAAD